MRTLIHDAPLKNWKPVVSFVEGLASVVVQVWMTLRLNVVKVRCFLQVCQILRAATHFLDCELIFTFHMTDLAPFAMRDILGLGLHSIGEIVTQMNIEGCASGGLSALLRSIKRDRTWELVFLHP